MKFTSESQLPSIASEDLKEKNFGILANEKMFGILSSKIYSDKILAPIRELSCNAYDANVDAGNGDAPIIVHIPTYEEPWFSVEDCGKGMDAHEIEDLYTTYGYSSKTETNNLIGCLGLGSKSPFAYTDRFSVVSRKNSTEYFYQCIIENSMPKLIKFGETPTSEPSGTKVQFEVNPSDVYFFQSRCSQFYNNFFPAPVFVGFSLKKDPYKFDNDRFYSSDNLYERGVLMGNVIYRYSIEDFLKENDYDEFVRAFRRMNTVIKADIGDIDITVSRESVEMTKKSKDYIAKVHLDHLENVKKEFTEIVPGPDGPIEFIKKVNDLSKFNRFLSSNEIDDKIALCDIPLDEETTYLTVTNDRGVIHRVLRTRSTFQFSKRMVDGPIMFVKEDYDKPIVSSFMDTWIRAEKGSSLIVFLSDSLKTKLEASGVQVVDKSYFGQAAKTSKAKLSKSKEYLGVYKVERAWDDRPLKIRFEAISDEDTFDFSNYTHIYYLRIHNKAVLDEEVESIRNGCNISRPLYLINYPCPTGTVIVGLNKEAYEKYKSDPKFSSYAEYLNERFSCDKPCYLECRAGAILSWFGNRCFPLTLVDPDILDIPEECKQLLKDAHATFQNTDEEELLNFKDAFMFKDAGLCKETFEKIKERYWIFHALMKHEFDYEDSRLSPETVKKNLEKMIEKMNEQRESF